MKKIITILSAFLLMFAFATSVSAATPEDLVGWWEFEDNAYDSTANNLDGTAHGNILYVDGIVGRAASFDGADDYVNVPDSESLNITDYTLELWIEANNFDNTYPTLLNRGVQSKTVGYYWIWIKSNKIVLTYTDGGLARSESWVTPFSTGEQYHIALTNSGSFFTMYKNGVSLGERDLTYIDAIDGDLFIGTYQGKIDSRYNFDGIIDEVRIWDRELSDNELNDVDMDSVKDDMDKCPGTTFDTPDEEKLGVNRHIWDGEFGYHFTTMASGKKDTRSETSSRFSLVDTYGCSCEQILDEMKDATGFEFGGHYKYGCSKSIIEDWMAGEYYVETVEVLATSSTPVSSVTMLEAGKDYFLKAYGMVNAGDTIDFDAKYSITNRIIGDTWTDTVSGYVSYGTSLLDLFVDSINVDWGSLDETNHTYQIPYAGNGSTVSFLIYDICYPNNIGSLFVDIFVKLW